MGILSAAAKATSKAKKKLTKEGKGIRLGLSKDKEKTVQVEVVQDRIRKAAKRAGTTVKAFRQKNPKNTNVKKLYSLKPRIKSDDKIRADNKITETRRRARDAAAKKAKTFTGFERNPKAAFTKRELEILRKQWKKAGGQSGTGQTFSQFKNQYRGFYYDT